MRDCVFLVADSQIEAMLKSFLGRERFNMSLGCGEFDFKSTQDVLIDPNRDPGIYSRGSQLLAPFTASHRRAVVMLDSAWEGSPGSEAIRQKISYELESNWEAYRVVVLDPEIESWIWQDNPHVMEALGGGDYAALRAELEARDLWREGEGKPYKPKEAVEFTLRRARVPRSAALYGQIASRISLKACVDPAFLDLRQGFVDWFGPAT